MTFWWTAANERPLLRDLNKKRKFRSNIARNVIILESRYLISGFLYCLQVLICEQIVNKLR